MPPPLSFLLSPTLRPPHHLPSSISPHPIRTAMLLPKKPFAQISSLSMSLQVSSSDALLTTSILTLATMYIFLIQKLSTINLLPPKSTRKLLHLTCAPAFLCFWPFYSSLPSARYLASILPAIFLLTLVISGTSLGTSAMSSLGRSISRQGAASEALQGPLYYTVVLLATTLLLFKSTLGAVVLTQVAFGDGLAEVIGKRFGEGNQWGWEWTGDKSMAGSMGFVVGGFVGGSGMVWWLEKMEMIDGGMVDQGTWWKLIVVSLVCAIVELGCPVVLGDDNLSVAVAAAVVGACLFGVGGGI